METLFVIDDADANHNMVECERLNSNCIALYQDNGQPTNDSIYLSKETAKALRDQLNKLEL
jgi:hypothetical protein